MNSLLKQKVGNKKTQGFTLIELMIVVAIMGLITVAAWPSYDRYQTKSRRADGISALLEARNNIEKCYINFAAADSSNLGYTNANCAPATNSPNSPNSREGHYVIDAPVRTAEAYTLRATPQGAQVDGECTKLTLTNLGVKGFKNTNSGGDPVGSLKRCWSQ